MTKQTRPSFITTKGQRKTAGAINIEDIEMHYRDILRSMYIWTGMPEDMPIGFVDADALYFYEGFALKNVRGMGICGFPCHPTTLDIYGNPIEWIASPFGWTVDGREATNDGSEIFRSSDMPVLWNRIPIRNRILPFLQIMTRALQTLGTNISSLAHPVLMTGMASGNPGDNLGAILLKNEMEEGSTYIPVVRPDAMGLEALDLKTTDNTQNLASIVDWCDARILEIIGASSGVEKSSGISTLETKTGMGGLAMSTDAALMMRRDWADRANAALGTSIAVSRNNAIEQMIDSDEDERIERTSDDNQESDTIETGEP